MTDYLQEEPEHPLPSRTSYVATLPQQGSTYEEYDKTHPTYDLTRLPIGQAEIVEELGKVGKLCKLRILDAGCGTGLYTEALLKAGAGSIYAIDASLEGIRQTSLKVRAWSDVTTAIGDIRSIPVSDGSFQAALYNFVLHHLGLGTDNEQAIAAVLAEAYRVLEDAGMIIIGTCTQQQLSCEDGCGWYAPYFRDAAEALAERFMPVDKLQQQVLRAGFIDAVVVKPAKCSYTSESFNPEGPFNADWRAGDSLFSFYNDKPELLARELLALRKAIESGEVMNQIQSATSRAEAIGQVVFVVARKTESRR